MDRDPILGGVIGGETERPVAIYTRTIILWAVGLSIDTELLWEHMAVAGRRSRPQALVVSETLRFEQTAPAPGGRRRAGAPGEPPQAGANGGALLHCGRPPAAGCVDDAFRTHGSFFLGRRAVFGDCGSRGVTACPETLSTASKRRGALDKRDKSSQTFRSVLSSFCVHIPPPVSRDSGRAHRMKAPAVDIRYKAWAGLPQLGAELGRARAHMPNFKTGGPLRTGRGWGHIACVYVRMCGW